VVPTGRTMTAQVAAPMTPRYSGVVGTVVGIARNEGPRWELLAMNGNHTNILSNVTVCYSYNLCIRIGQGMFLLS